jgi:hypothetical protein
MIHGDMCGVEKAMGARYFQQPSEYRFPFFLLDTRAAPHNRRSFFLLPSFFGVSTDTVST